MVLGEALEDADGISHAMLGLLGHATSFAKRKMNLGYRRATLRAEGPLGRAGTTVRGHEFHYAQMTAPGTDEAFADLADGQGNPLPASGGRRGNVSGTFFHAIAKDGDEPGLPASTLCWCEGMPPWPARGDIMTLPPLRQLLDDIALCFVFFTRLPLPVFDFRDRTLAQAIWAAPLAGVAVAVIGSIAYTFATMLGLFDRHRGSTGAGGDDARHRLPA